MDNILARDKDRYWFSVFLALYPVLCLYQAFGNITIGDFLLLCFVIIGLFKNLPINNRNNLFLLFGIYVISITTIDLAISSKHEILIQSDQAIIRAIKLFIYIICLVFVSNNINLKVLQKWLIILGLISSIFYIFQYVMFFIFNKIILGQIPGLNLYLSEYTEIDYSTFYSYNFRPSSIFLEPAMAVQVIIVPLLFILFSTKPIKHKSQLIVLLSTAIILSTSAQGIVFLLITFVYYNFFQLKRRFSLVVVFCACMLLVYIGYIYIDPLHLAIDRLLFNDNASDARLSSYHYCFEMLMPQMLIGNGYGCIPNNEYLPGAAYVWYGTGLIGLAFAIYLFLSKLSSKNSLLSNILLIMFFVMFWSTALFYNYMFFWFFSIIISTSTNSLKRHA